MTLGELLHLLVEDGLASLSSDLTAPSHAMRLAGGREGLEACRNQEPGRILELLADARDRRHRARLDGDPTLVRQLWREAQIEYVARVISVGLELQNQSPIVTPDAAAFARYIEIVGWEPRRIDGGTGTMERQER